MADEHSVILLHYYCASGLVENVAIGIYNIDEQEHQSVFQMYKDVRNGCTET